MLVFHSSAQRTVAEIATDLGLLIEAALNCQSQEVIIIEKTGEVRVTAKEA